MTANPATVRATSPVDHRATLLGYYAGWLRALDAAGGDVPGGVREQIHGAIAAVEEYGVDFVGATNQS